MCLECIRTTLTDTGILAFGDKPPLEEKSSPSTRTRRTKHVSDQNGDAIVLPEALFPGGRVVNAVDLLHRRWYRDLHALETVFAALQIHTVQMIKRHPLGFKTRPLFLRTKRITST